MADAAVLMATLRNMLDSGTAEVALRDLAYTVGQLGQGSVQYSFIAANRAELRSKLAIAEQGKGATVYTRRPDGAGKLAFLFPGQGSQAPGMLAQMFVAFPHLRANLDHGRYYLDALFPAPAPGVEGRKAQALALADTRLAQPALGVRPCGPGAAARAAQRGGAGKSEQSFPNRHFRPRPCRRCGTGNITGAGHRRT